MAKKLTNEVIPNDREALMGDIQLAIAKSPVAVSVTRIGWAVYAQVIGGANIKVQPLTGNGNKDTLGVVLTAYSGDITDSQTIKFDQVLKRAPDNRPDYTAGLYIWSYNDEERWYIARPISMKPLYTQIASYLSLWVKEVK